MKISYDTEVDALSIADKISVTVSTAGK